MTIDGIKFPDDLIESIQKKELVVFAGAGVSMGKPTCLPSFAQLTKLIAKDTFHSVSRRKDYEVFLGELKNNWGSGDGPDVNKLAADILSEKCKEPNRLHKALLGLFEQPEDIKIVTTNYDQMFEIAAHNLGIHVKAYDAPALPLGNDISGIIHLHGNVNNYKYIILTDEDFGRAYLTDGYASRFLVQLFTQYDVLFVGYSLNDTVLRYLTKAMSRVSDRNKYILTDNSDGKWKSYKIVPIDFPDRDYDAMTEAVEHLGEQARKSLIQWKSFFVDIQDAPPKDLTEESIVSYCLKDENKAKIMAQIISGDSWVNILNDKGIFDDLFKKDVKLSNDDLLWMGWLSKNIIGKKIFFDLFAKHKNILNDKFAENLISNIIVNEKSIADDMLQKQIILLSSYIKEDYLIYALLDVADRRDLMSLYWFLYKQTFNVAMLCENRVMFYEYTAFTHKTTSNAYSIHEYWKKRERDLIGLFSIAILRFCVEYVESLHNNYVLIGQADSQDEPWRVVKFPIEHREVSYLFDGLNVMADMFLAASLGAEKSNAVALKGILSESINSESLFLRRLALISIRETTVYSYKQKLKIIIEHDLLLSKREKPETKKLISSIFDKLDLDEKTQLLSDIESVPHDNDFERASFIYSYLFEISQTCHPFPYVDTKIKQLDEQYELSNYFFPTSPRLDDRFYFNSEDIFNLDEENLKDFFCFVCSNNKESQYHELMDEISKAAGLDYKWTYSAVKLMVELEISDESLWKHMLYGIANIHNSVEEHFELLKVLVNPLVLKNNIVEISRIFLKFLRLKDANEFFLLHENDIYSLFAELWKYKRIEEDLFDVLMQSLNTSVGLLVYSSIFMIDHHKERAIPERYKLFLSDCLSMEGQEYYVSLCVLAGHYGFFHYKDVDWCNSVFNPILSGDVTDEEYACSWAGFALYTGGLNVDTVDDLSKVIFKAICKMDILSKDAHQRFLDLYFTLLFHVVSRPGAKYIPKFYKYASDDDKCYFVSSIKYRLKKMEPEKKVKLWKKWLKQHLINRTNNKPVQPTEAELQEYLNWLPYLKEVFDEAVEIMCGGLLPKKVSIKFFSGLIESEIPKLNPECTCHLIINLCRNGSKPEFGDVYVKKIISMMGKLPRAEEIVLENELIKSGWCQI